jgi:RNA polymerase sigma-70 factor (ECF subfamily)
MVPTLEQHLKTYLPDLWRYAFSLTHSRDMADDLVQDCAERALRKRHLLDNTAAVKPWLMTMLLNIYRNQYKTRANRGAHVPIDDVDAAAPDTLGAQLELTDTMRSLSQLPDDQREALLLVVVSGLSYKDAAAALELPIGTVMSRIGRARATLRAAQSGLSEVTA